MMVRLTRRDTSAHGKTGRMCSISSIRPAIKNLITRSHLAQALAARLKHVRERQGFSQAELAEAIGDREQTVSQRETGRRVPSLWTLYRTAEALGVSVASLLPKPCELG